MLGWISPMVTMSLLSSKLIFDEMKHYIILTFLIFTLSCKAQTIIVPLGSGDPFEHNPNYYVKDVSNEFNRFAGIWKYQNGNTQIIFKLKKEALYQISATSNYEDLLVGEYQYIENGIEKVNTLSGLDNPSITGYTHKISGGTYIHNLPSYCIDNSNAAEIKVEVQIDHPTDEYAEGRVILRHIIEDGIEKLQACIYDYTYLGDNDVRLDIPDGYYEFVKQ